MSKVTIENGDLEVVLNEKGLRIDSLKFKGRDFMFPFSMLDYGRGAEKPRGTHFGDPVFGKPPKESGLRGKIPQHGFLREMNIPIKKQEDSVAFVNEFSMPSNKNYPWKISHIMWLICYPNRFYIEIHTHRELDDIPTLAPFNFGLHAYWVNKSGVRVNMEGYQGKLDQLIIPAYHAKYLGPVRVDLKDIGIVTMAMKSTQLADPEVLFWTDHHDFSCVELVASNTKNFDTEKGLWLDQGQEIETIFEMIFEI